MWQVYTNFSLLAVLLILVLLQLKRLNPSLKAIGIFAAVTACFHLWAAYHFVFTKKNNQYIFHILTPIQYSLLVLYFYFLPQMTKLRQLLLYSIVVFVSFSLVISLTVQPFEQYNSYGLILQNLLIVLWSLIYFRNILREEEFQDLKSQPEFFITAGLLFFGLGDFFLEGIMNYMINNKMKESIQLYYTSEILSFVLYTLFIIAFLVNFIKKNPEK